MRVFISHSSQDQWVATAISNELARRGIETFLDSKDLRTGVSLNRAIRSHLEDCDELMVLISPPALNSQWVFHELGQADALGLPVIPILLHVGANQMPSMLAHRLARDINHIGQYFREAMDRATKGKPAKKKAIAETRASAIDSVEALAAHKTTKVTAFRKGALVRIADPADLSITDRELPPTYTREMGRYAGQRGKIVDVRTREGVPGGRVYFLDIDDQTYTWIEPWLLPP